MPEIQELFRDALRDEPPPTVHVDDVVEAARRRGGHRRVTVMAAAAVGGAGLAAAMVAIAVTSSSSPSGSPRHPAGGHVGAGGQPAPSTSTAPTAPTAPTTSAAPAPAPRGVTVKTLPGQIERGGDLGLIKVDVSYLPAPAYDVDLAAGVSSVHGTAAEGQYLNVQVMRRGATSGRPSCAGRSAGVNGDGYFGTCSVRRLSGGSWLLVRSGTTKAHGYRKNQAELYQGGGRAILAEADNQRFRPGNVSGNDPVVSHDPPITTHQLADLVQYLAAQE